MVLLGRFHLVRVILALLFVLLFIAILNNYNTGDVIKISSKSIQSLSFTWSELESLSKVCKIFLITYLIVVQSQNVSQHRR